jgi:hypothetical protein
MIAASASYNSYLSREVLFPKFKLLSYALSQAEPWSELIAGTYSQTPVDLTPYVQSIEFTHESLRIQLADEAALLFHPDAGALRTTIGPGRAIRLREGYEGLPESEWLWTFSGTVEGSYTWSYSRDSQIDVSLTVYGRGSNQAWKRRNVTSKAYTIGSDWSLMFLNIVKDVMMLADNEVAIPTPWNVLFDKNSNQVVNYPPWDGMEQLLWGISARPFFNGEGKLDLISLTQNRVTQVLANDNYLMKYEARSGGSEAINKVLLTYLSNTLSRVDGADQVLGTATITAGFLLNSRSEDVYYSDERKTRSDNPRLVVTQSVNASFLPVGTEGLVKLDEFHSRIDVEVPIWAGLILLTLFASYVTIAAGINFLADLIGAQLAMAVLLITILLFMSTIGTGSYEVWGTPYEMVYLEQQAIAMKSGVEFWQEREKEIRNDFISTPEQAQPLVLTQLHYEVMKEQPRTLALRYDPRIEPGDVLELSSSVRIYVEDVKRGMRRGTVDPLVMTVTGYRTVL